MIVINKNIDKMKILKETIKKHSHLCIVCCAILLFVVQMTLLNSFLLAKQMKENENEVSRVIQRQMAVDESSVQNIIAYGTKIASDKDVIRFFEQNETEMDNLIDIGTILREEREFASSYIDDIYLYNGTTGLVYDSYMKLKTLEEFDDRETAEELKKGNFERKKNVVNISNGENGQNDGSISYIFSENKRAQNAVILNVNYSKMTKDYSSMQIDLEREIIVVNDDGKVLYGGKDNPLGEDVSNEEFFQKRNENGENQVYKSNGEKKIANYFYSEQCGRWYISIANYNKTVSFGISDGRIVFCVMTDLLLIIFVIYLLKILKQLKNDYAIGLENMKVMWNNNFKSEDAQIKLFEYMKSPKNDDGTETDEAKRYLPMGFDTEHMSVICVDIDSVVGETEVQQKDMDLYRYAVNNICSEIINRYLYCCKCFESERRIIYMVGNAEEIQYSKQHNKIAAECAESVYENLQVKISVCMSRVYAFENMNEAYKEMSLISQYKFVYGANSIIDWTALHEANSEQVRDCVKICRNIGNLMIENNEECYETFEDMMNRLYDMNIFDVKEVILNLRVFMQQTADTLHKRNKKAFDLTTEKLEKIKNANGLPEISDIFRELIEGLNECVETVIGKEKQSVVENAVEIIKSEYADESICVADIAERLGLSASYLGKLFKRSKGISVADFINNVRLEEAEKLLCGTNKKISEVMEATGFTNNSYFAVLFKKKYDETPSAYRKMSRVKKKETE